MDCLLALDNDGPLDGYSDGLKDKLGLTDGKSVGIFDDDGNMVGT